MKELLATIHFTAFSRSDADAHVERLTGELHAVRMSVYGVLTVRGSDTPRVLKPSWMVGEVARVPTHLLALEHTVSERRGRFYCETRIGLGGSPPTISPDEEPLPDTVKSVPPRRH